MSLYAPLHMIHLALAVVTIAGFLLRGYWQLTGSDWSGRRVVRVLPHIVDTLFLASGIALVAVLNLAVLQNGWLLAKFAGLFAYIGLGMVALRFGRTPQLRLIAFAGAVAAFAYIVGAALTKSPASWLAYVAG
ncbi:MAG: SirB2 family protein [Woeseiaceae bacterium]|nr:SirB2 family protein [Woeseiaceae bacterium]